MSFSSSSSYPMVANTDYSPANDILSYPDAFDKAYLADMFTSRPDYTFDTTLDTNAFFDQTINSVEPSPSFDSKNQAFFNTSPMTATATSPTNLNSCSDASQVPFGRLGSLNDAFSTSPTFKQTPTPFTIPSTSPQDSSPTPSLCGDGPQLPTTSSPSLSPRTLKRESPDEAASLYSDPPPKRPIKKRGRPRQDRTSADTTNSSASAKARAAARLPHNQVERKYREGLNAELERLRRAVPTLIQKDTGDLTGPPKPSKATILACAIEYIKTIERERDGLLVENEKLKGARGGRNR